MQRVAHNDLTSHLLKTDGWEHLKIPVIAEKDESYPEVFGSQVTRRKGDVFNASREDRGELRDML